MLRAAVDAYGCSGRGLVDEMLRIVRGFIRWNPEFEPWGSNELRHLERNDELFREYLERP
jgi:hypothetical protein